MKHAPFLMLAFLMHTATQADCIDSQRSIIIAPRIGAVVKTESPVIIGIVKNTQQKPVIKKPISVYIDNAKVANVLTDANGVWSYRLSPTQALSNGVYHTAQAALQSSSTSTFWIQGTMFLVDIENARYLRAVGNVNTANSEINFPIDGGAINTATPTIIGTLLDQNFNPVAGETVAVYVDSSLVGTVSSNSNGVFSFAISSALSDAVHTMSVHCVESSVDLSALSFTIDTVAPVVPVITLPAILGTVSTTFTVTGISEPYAIIQTFLDNDTYGQITYADEIGAWSIDYSADPGMHTITAQATDLAGNQSDVTASRLFTVSL